MSPKEASSLREVCYGLKLVLSSLVLTMLGSIATYFALLVTLGPRWTVPELVRSLSLLVSVCAAVVAILGQVYCLYVPKPARARGMATLAVIGAIAGLLLELAPRMPVLAPLADFSRFAGAAKLLSYSAFLVFIRRLAWFVEAKVVAAEARSVLKQSILLDLAYFALVVASGVLVGLRSPLILMALGVLLIVVGLGAFFVFLRYLGVIASLRLAIEAALVEIPAKTTGLI